MSPRDKYDECDVSKQAPKSVQIPPKSMQILQTNDIANYNGIVNFFWQKCDIALHLCRTTCSIVNTKSTTVEFTRHQTQTLSHHPGRPSHLTKQNDKTKFRSNCCPSQKAIDVF